MSLQQSVNQEVPLNKKVDYPQAYNKDLLFPVSRLAQRQAMRLPDINFVGFDEWMAYEIYWLNSRGKPVRNRAKFLISAASPNICESKSVKLYLNSLNHQRFKNENAVVDLIKEDLTNLCGDDVHVFFMPDNAAMREDERIHGFRCLDDLDIEIVDYKYNPDLLKVVEGPSGHHKIVSHLFKSHCLCTGQPDLGSIFVEYEGSKIDEASLLSYLISFRDHAGFAENCIEQIFSDIYTKARPMNLTIFGRFTRRGGIAIHPYRSTNKADALKVG